MRRGAFILYPLSVVTQDPSAYSWSFTRKGSESTIINKENEGKKVSFRRGKSDEKDAKGSLRRTAKRRRLNIFSRRLFWEEDNSRATSYWHSYLPRLSPFFLLGSPSRIFIAYDILRWNEKCFLPCPGVWYVEFLFSILITTHIRAASHK